MVLDLVHRCALQADRLSRFSREHKVKAFLKLSRALTKGTAARLGRPVRDRVLFAFDPTRSALLLLGGDKAGNWQRWYRQNIPIAEQLYLEYTIEQQE